MRFRRNDDSRTNTPAVSDAKTIRSTLHDRTRTDAKGHADLAEMQRLGFWPPGRGVPEINRELVQREEELLQALHELSAGLANVEDPKKVLQKMRREQSVKMRERRQAKELKNRDRLNENAAARERRRRAEVLYLGPGVSQGLGRTLGDRNRLAALSLPAPRDVEELGIQMGVPLPELRFLAYARKVSRVNHYRYFYIAKKNGGQRLISSPMPRLKRAQYWILDNILAKVPVHEAAHGFVPGRSIVSNAELHVGQGVVINLDLENFFPSIHYPRIKGVFRELGYSEQLATIFGLLCTESAVTEVEIGGERYFIRRSPRCLPQGAPTSPALTNILCRRLDRRLSGLAERFDFRYTRYADDMTFSAAAGQEKQLGRLLWRVKAIIAEEGFTVHPEKQHVMRAHRQQQVTGLVVNRKLSVDRKTLRRFRAVLHRLEQGGAAALDRLSWNGRSDVLAALEGYASFIVMVDENKGRSYLKRVQALRAEIDGQIGAPGCLSKYGVRSDTFRRRSARGEAPWKGWWRSEAESLPGEDNSIEQKRAQWLAQSKRFDRQRLFSRLGAQIGVGCLLALLFGGPTIFAVAFVIAGLAQWLVLRSIDWRFYAIFMLAAVLIVLIVG